MQLLYKDAKGVPETRVGAGRKKRHLLVAFYIYLSQNQLKIEWGMAGQLIKSSSLGVSIQLLYKDA